MRYSKALAELHKTNRFFIISYLFSKIGKYKLRCVQSNTFKLYKNYRKIRNQNRNMYLKFWSRSDNFKISIPSLAVPCSFSKLASIRPWATLYSSYHFINLSETWYILMKKNLTEFFMRTSIFMSYGWLQFFLKVRLH